MCDTPNRPVKYTPLLPTGHRGMAAFDRARETHWALKTCLGTLMCYFGTNNRLLIYALCVILPTGQWGTPHYSQPATEKWLHLTGHVKHIEHWKPCLGALMCYFGTNNRLLIYALCVILPTGQWGTPHYSQPTTEEWLHLTAIWGTWNTLNIENHVWGGWCVISVCVIFQHILQKLRHIVP